VEYFVQQLINGLIETFWSAHITYVQN